MSTDHLLRILKPTTLRVCRQNPDRVTIGDMAEARVETGLLDLLTSPVAGVDLPLGAGILPEVLVCHGIAGTAAYVALGDTERKQSGFDWAGTELDLTWKRPGRRGEALIGRARVGARRAMTLNVDVETSSEATGEVIMTGCFQFVAVRDGHALLLEDEMLLFEQPAPEASPETSPTRLSRRVTNAIRSPRATIRRLCSRLRGSGQCP